MSESALVQIPTLIFSIAIGIGISLILREIICWYGKVNARLQVLKSIEKHLDSLDYKMSIMLLDDDKSRKYILNDNNQDSQVTQNTNTQEEINDVLQKKYEEYL